MKTLVLGLGNLILADDAAGIRIARLIKEARPELDVEESNEAALSLLDLLAGYERLIIIDSIKTAGGRPGRLHRLSLADFGVNLDGASSHGVDIATAFEIGRNLGCEMPERVSIYALEVKDNETFTEALSPEVLGSISLVAGLIIDEEKL